MSKVERESRGDFFFGNLDKKLGKDKLVRGPTPIELDEVENFLDDAAGSGKKITAGLKGAVASLDAIRQCGLTPDAFIVLVVAKCRPDKNNNPTSEAAVQRVLEGLFRLGSISDDQVALRESQAEALSQREEDGAARLGGGPHRSASPVVPLRAAGVRASHRRRDRDREDAAEGVDAAEAHGGSRATREEETMTGLKSFEIKCLDHGYVRYIDHMGSDEAIVEAARMSTGRGFVSWEPYARCEVCEEVMLAKRTETQTLAAHCEGDRPHEWKQFPRGDAGILEFLYSNRHMTPFEMCELVVEVKAPIFVFRELHRHRTFSINEMSARYTQMPNEHYVPEQHRFSANWDATNKQASSAGVPVGEGTPNAELQRWVREEQDKIYDTYEALLDSGVRKEVARINTPVSRYSVMRWKANLRNWLQMFALRWHPAAQWECQKTIEPVVEIVRNLFPRTIALYEEHTKYAVTLSRTEAALLKNLLKKADHGGSSSDFKDADWSKEEAALVERLTK